MAVKRERRLSMLISDEEHEMLQGLADRAGITASDWIRMQIRQAHESTAAPPPKPKKPKR